MESPPETPIFGVSPPIRRFLKAASLRFRSKKTRQKASFWSWKRSRRWTTARNLPFLWRGENTTFFRGRITRLAAWMAWKPEIYWFRSLRICKMLGPEKLEDLDKLTLKNWCTKEPLQSKLKPPANQYVDLFHTICLLIWFELPVPCFCWGTN